MNIAFNALNAKIGAGISVLKTLLPAISKVDKKNKYFIFLSSKHKDIIQNIPTEFTKIVFKKVPNNPYLRTLWEQIVLPYYIHKLGIDVLYSGGNSTILFAPCKILLFIENTNPFSRFIANWSFKDRLRIKILYFLGLLSALRANKVRFCSKRSMEIISQVYNIKNEKSFVLYHGIDFDKINNLNYRKEYNFSYILTVSVVAPHKNIEVLLGAFKKLKKKGIFSGKLIIIGNNKAYSKYFKKLLDLCKNYKIDKDVLFLGEISHEYVFNFYKYAELFIFPSVEETFGIPLIEAMYFDIPVIASDGNKYKEYFIPFNEIAEDKIVFFDPFSIDDLYIKISKVLYGEIIFDKNIKFFVKNKFSINDIARKLVEQFNKLESY